MSNERERALEAARRITASVHEYDCMLVARALLASSPPPSCEMRKALDFFFNAEKALTDYENEEWSAEAVDPDKIYRDIELARKGARAALDASRTACVAGDHAWEAEDDKGWRCALCGAVT